MLALALEQLPAADLDREILVRADIGGATHAFTADCREANIRFARGEMSEGRPVLAAWCSPWLAVERVGKTGLRFGRAWRLGQGQNLYGIDLLIELPRADLWWSPGEPRPGDLRELLAMADEDWPENEADGPP